MQYIILFAFSFHTLYAPIYAITTIDPLKIQTQNYVTNKNNFKTESTKLFDSSSDSSSLVNKEDELLEKKTEVPVKKSAHNYTNEIREDNLKTGKEIQVLFSDISGGFIGGSLNSELDDPSDNIFKFNIDGLNKINTAFVTYEVKGVAEASSVVKSINESTSTGGYFVKTNNEWTTIKEQVSLNSLKEGKNIVMFTTPSLEKIAYQVKNVRLEIQNQNLDEVTIQNTNQIFSIKEGKLYVKGNVPNNWNIKEVKVNTQVINYHEGEFEGFINFDEQENSNIEIELTNKEGITKKKAIEVIGTVTSDYFFNHPNLNLESKIRIDEGQNILEAKETFLEIPEGAISKGAIVKVQPLREKDIAPNSSNIINVTKSNKGYRYLPDGTSFDKEVKIGISYDKNLIPKGYSEKDIKTFFFDTDSKLWKSIPTDTVDVAKEMIVSKTTHFTDYISGIIKAPDSPETNSFTPSSIQDLKIADPSSGFNEIQMPEANQQGDASLIYSFELPVSKNGVKPSLGIQYNNNGGNGWLGLGWDLNIPSIEVDTRWGVPRFDTSKETEGYVMAGEELLLEKDIEANYVPQFSQLIDRVSDASFITQQKQPGAFIKRSGNNPEDYSWEIKDKNGNTHFYGLTENGKFRKGSGTSGPIARWMLEKTIDKNGNFISYLYEHVNFTDGPLSDGKQIYISKITYAFNEKEGAHSFQQGYYIVDFYRKKRLDNSGQDRPDKSFSNRFGFKEVTYDLLDKVIITPHDKSEVDYFSNEYQFKYGQGQFSKALLQSVVNVHKYEEKPDVAYDHRFTYYNDIEDGHLFENNATTIYTENDYAGTFENKGIEPTFIGGGNGDFRSWNLGVSFGMVVPFFPQSYIPFSKSLTLGVNFTKSESTNDTKTALMDIDGDGLPDKVFKRGRTDRDLFYRKNLGGTFSAVKFELPKGFDLAKTRSESETKTVIANVFMISGNASISKSNSTNYKFLDDVNNDGLVDFIDNTNVHFSYIDPNTKLPIFSQDSSVTPNVIMKEEDVAPILEQLPDLSLKNDLMDIVKVWEAPVDGKINISGTIYKEHVALENGVRYAIERTTNNLLINGPFVPVEGGGIVIPTDPVVITPGIDPILRDLDRVDYIKEPALLLVGNESTNFSNISVKKGDKIFFRVGSSQLPLEDLLVNWNPKIDYTTTNFDSPNAFKKYSSSYSDAFLLTESKEFVINQPGIYNLNWSSFVINNLNSPSELSDNVRLKVTYYKNDTNVTQGPPIKRNPFNNSTDIEIYSKIIKMGVNNTIGAFSISLNAINVVETDPTSYQYVKIELLSDSEVNWAVLQNKFKPLIRNMAISEADNLVAYMSNYPNNHTNFYHTNFASFLERSITIMDNFVLPGCTTNSCQDQYVYLTAKTPKGKYVMFNNMPIKFRFKINGAGQVIEKKQEDGNGNWVVPSNFVFSTSLQDIYFEMFTDTKSLANKLVTYQKTNDFVYLTNGPATKTEYVTTPGADNSGVYKVNIFSKENMKGFGPMFRNWGQFAYKGGQPGQDMPKIKLKHLRFAGNFSSANPNDTFVPNGQSMEEFYSDQASAEAAVSPDGGQTLNMDFMNSLTNEDFPIMFFQPLLANMNTGSWQGHKQLFVSKTKIAPYTRFEDGDTTLPMIPIYHGSPYGAVSIRKETYTEGESNSVGITTLFGGESNTFSSGNSKILNDTRDLNGDGYPDIIGGTIQLTSSRGGLSNRFINKNLNISSTYDGVGRLSSGSPAIAGKEVVCVGDKEVTIMTVRGIGGVSLSLGSDSHKVKDRSSAKLVDINGDGLPDFLYKNGTIELNYGYGFQNFSGSLWSTSFDVDSTTKTYGFNAGVGLPTGAVLSNSDLSIGGNLGVSESTTNSTYIDVNGDGLIDQVTEDSKVYINTGTSFTSSSVNLPGAQITIGANGGMNGNVSVSFSFPFLFGVGPKFSLTGGGSLGENISLSKSNFMDFDGDGYVDFVESNNDHQIKVRLSKIKRTNMLKSVVRPLGAIISLDYDINNPISNSSIGSTYKMPFKKWVLTKAEIFDGHVGDGADIQKFAFEYSSGLKDRRKRKFLGFGEVKTHQLKTNGDVYRSSVKEYFLKKIIDEHLYQRGDAPALRQYFFKRDLITREYMIDENNRIHSEKKYEYSFFSPVNNPSHLYSTDAADNAYFSDTSQILTLAKNVESSITNFDESTTDGSFTQTTSVKFDEYDSYANVTKYKEDIDNIEVNIKYHYLDDLNYFTAPSEHIVLANGHQMRKSTTLLDDTTGDVIEISKISDSNEIVKSNMEYDVYGNLIKVILPKSTDNANEDTRMFYKYKYNNYFKNRVINVQDAYGFSSNTTYNALGQPIMVEDLNNNIFKYEYDALGRMTSFKGPYNTDWTIRNEYHVYPGQKAFAITRHHLVNPLNSLEESEVGTSTMIDGLGRVIQTKKQLLLNEDCDDGFNFAVSGKIIYDEFGRGIASHLSKQIENCNANANDLAAFISNYTVLNHTDTEKTITDYNYKDQSVFVKVLGLNATTLTTFGYGRDAFNVMRFTQKVILPEGNTSVSYIDEKGKTTTTKQIGDSEELVTKYNYDALGQLKMVTDAADAQTNYKYDGFGQVIEKHHPDAGTHLYNYDLTGKLISEQNANLINAGTYITYEYHFNQLRTIEYPSHKVIYEYGEVGNLDNGVGRVIKQTDLTGTQNFKYGALGEVTETEREIKTDSGDARYFRTSFLYDSWGKMHRVIYPDRETLFYKYNLVGQLNQVVNSDRFIYLKSVDYNFFDQPTKIVYGNGVINYSEFDLTQRLRANQLNIPQDKILMRNIYSYDKNQNIKSVSNNRSLADDLHIGGTYYKEYAYDQFNRLATAKGAWNGFEESHSYNLGMKYNVTHGITEKIQNHTESFNGNATPSENSYENKYLYDTPHRIEKIEVNHHLYGGDRFIDFKYDLNGNITDIDSNSRIFPENRSFLWDEQNRLIGVVDKEIRASHYVYDASGERILKQEADIATLDINGEQVYAIGNISDYTIYPNAYITLNKEEYTKHYYINSKRFVSRIGKLEDVGNFSNPKFELYSERNAFAKPNTINIQRLLSRDSENDDGEFLMTTFDANQNNTNCLNQINILLNLHYPTQNPSRIHCRSEILAVIDAYPNDACTALMLINEMTCIERDDVTGFPIDNDGNIRNPYTGDLYNPGQSPGGGSTEGSGPFTTPPQDQEELDCFLQLQQQYVYYLENFVGSQCLNLLLQIINSYGQTSRDTYCNILLTFNQKHCGIKLDEDGNPIEEGSEPNNPGEIVPPDSGEISDDWVDDGDATNHEEDDTIEIPEALPIWWYHTDHLGSSSYLTDSFGRPSHYYDQLPFGESMVEHNQSSYYNNGYKFNGKEQDEATGMYYYGARYYDPRISIFISVDPLAEKTMTPYQYVGNNPIMFTDPTGMERNGIETELFNSEGKKIGEDANGNDGNVSIIKNSDNAKQIEKNYKKNGVSSQNEVNSGVMTTKQELQESLNVINRTINNGGLREESSIIGSSGQVYIGETGTEPEFNTLENGAVIMTAEATLYALPSSETSGVSIHSHLTSLPVHNDQPFPVSASSPSQADNSNWTQNGLNRNIIVGRLRAGNVSNIVKNGKEWKDKRDLGAAIYIGSNSRKPAVELNTKAIQNILK